VASIPIPGWHSLHPVKNSEGEVLLSVYVKLLSPEAPVLAQNAPQTVWRPRFVRIRGLEKGKEGGARSPVSGGS